MTPFPIPIMGYLPRQDYLNLLSHSSKDYPVVFNIFQLYLYDVRCFRQTGADWIAEDRRLVEVHLAPLSNGEIKIQKIFFHSTLYNHIKNTPMSPILVQMAKRGGDLDDIKFSIRRSYSLDFVRICEASLRQYENMEIELDDIVEEYNYVLKNHLDKKKLVVEEEILSDKESLENLRSAAAPPASKKIF